jgi:hypothetical protein
MNSKERSSTSNQNMQHANMHSKEPPVMAFCYTIFRPWQVFEEKLAAEKKKLAEKQKAVP